MKLSAFFIQGLLSMVLLAGPDPTLAYSKTKTVAHDSKKNYDKQKLKTPGDLWDRIRTGLQIPQPAPPEKVIPIDQANAIASGNGQNLPDSNLDCAQKLAQKPHAFNKQRIIEPARLIAPNPNYTELGLQKLHPNDPRDQVETPEAKYTELGLKRLHPEKLRKSFKDCTAAQKAQDAEACKTNTFSAAGKKDLSEHANQDEPAPSPCHGQQQSAQVLEQQLQVIAKQQKQNTIYARVQSAILSYAQRPDYLQQVVNNSRPYLYYIVENLTQFKLPYELALLPIVESGYQPAAFSVKNAAGLWQFIPSTGLDFNLKRSERYDDRLDIEASTKAAMHYFTFLKQHYNGDWLLALASYNCGLGVVDAAIDDNFAQGLETDYWSLKLPNETQAYVPRLLALAAIFANPAQYQFKPNRISNEPYFIKVRIDNATEINYLTNKDLKTVAQLAGLDDHQVMILNPGFLNAKIQATKPFNLLMPEINAQRLRQRLESIAKIIVNSEKNAQPYSIKTQSIQDAANISPYAFPFFTLDVK